MPDTRRRHRSSPATVVLLVRHGKTSTTGVVLPGRTPGLHLSDDGRRQAEEVTTRLAGIKHIAAVYASPLERARETAAALARVRRLAVRIERGLLECDFGDWTGGKLAQLGKKPEWQVIQRYPSGFRFPGGESFTEMQTRITSTLARLVERHRGKTIVAVSHADPIKAAVAHALGMHLDLFQRIVIGTGSITAIAYRREAPAVLTVNSVTGDLRPLGIT
jgi:probable phosphoglycerate mutase